MISRKFLSVITLEMFSRIFFFQEPTPQYYDIEFRSLQYALFGCCFFQLAGSLCFLAMSWYILDDKREADRVIAETNGMIEDDHEAVHGDNDQAPIIQNEVVPEQSTLSS